MADMEDLFGSEAESEAERKGAAGWRAGWRAGELRGWAPGVPSCFPAGGAPPGTVALPRCCPAPPACPMVPASPGGRARSLRLEGQGGQPGLVVVVVVVGSSPRTCGLRPAVHTWPNEGCQ